MTKTISIKGLITEDFINYKKKSLVVEFPHCDFKCERECGIQCCQNSPLAQSPNTTTSISRLVNLYTSNDITEAVVFQGLEPLDSYDEMLEFVKALREKTLDDIVIYTGYNENEIEDKIEELKQFPNIIIKFGRFIPNDAPHYDDVLGVWLASHNQYAKKIS